MKNKRLIFLICTIFITGVFTRKSYAQEENPTGGTAKIEFSTDSLISLPDSLLHPIDHTLNSTLNKIVSAEDSFTSPLNKVEVKVDSVSNRIHEMETQPMQAEKKIESPVDNTEGKINSKLSLPGQSFKIDQMQVHTDGLSAGNVIPKVKLPALSSRLDLPSIPDLKEIQLPDMSKLENVGSAGNSLDEIRKYLPDDMKGQAKEISDLYSHAHSQKDIDQYIDNEAIKLDGTGELDKMNGQTQAVNTGLKSLSALDKLQLKEAFKNKKIKTQALSKLAEEGQKVAGDRFESIKGVKDKMMALKKKYSYVGSIYDLKNAKKVNSLKDEPLRKRIVLGGNMVIKRADPLALDVDPTLGYRFNAKLTLGLSGTYRFALAHNTGYVIHIPDQAYGYGAYGSYTLWKSIFGHAEFKSSSIAIKNNDLVTSRQWVSGFMVGLGNEYKLYGPIHGTVMLMYNTLHKSDPVDPRPWQVKFGVLIN